MPVWDIFSMSGYKIYATFCIKTIKLQYLDKLVDEYVLYRINLTQQTHPQLK